MKRGNSIKNNLAS